MHNGYYYHYHLVHFLKEQDKLVKQIKFWVK